MHTTRRSARAGMTLIEILIVLALIALLAGTVIMNVDKIFGQSQEGIAKITIGNFKVPLSTYKIQMGSYPTTEEGLQALITAPSNRAERWKGPYLDGKIVPLDPWGNPFQYRYPGSHNPDSYDVWSWGKDGHESADDIGNW